MWKILKLETTNSLASAGFDVETLHAMECDALARSLIRQHGLGGMRGLHSAPLTTSALDDLQKARDTNTMRIFFAMQHQMKDDTLDNTIDLGEFIIKRAENAYRLSMLGSEKSPQWTRVFYDFAEAYSYVIEAMQQMERSQMIAPRRIEDAKAMMTPPDLLTQPARAALFAEAIAYHTARTDCVEDPVPRT